MIRGLWGWLSSVWLGIFLLLNLAGLAVFVLLRFDPPEPYFLHPLYLGLLGAFGMNIACVLADRYRFRAAQSGFLATHVGIVAVLAGGALTHWGGEDGQVRILEGRSASVFTVDRTAGMLKARELRLADHDGLRRAVAFDVGAAGRLPAFDLPGTGIRVEVLDYLPRAERRRQAVPAEGAPPALRVRVGMAVAQMEEWLQADDPVTGERELGNRLLVRYRRVPGRAEDGWQALPDDKSLSFVEGADGALGLVESDGKGRRLFHAVPAGAGASLACALSPLTAAVLERQPAAVVVPGYAASAQGEEEVVFLSVSRGGETRHAWVPWGEPASLGVGGGPIFLAFASLQRDLGFTITLDDFRKVDYEGSALPMSYESHVRLDDPAAGASGAPRVISMNAPLVHGGWTFFQAAFAAAPSPGEPEATILQVSRDPGRPVVYTGAVLIVCGVLFMFYLKPWMQARGWL